MSKRPDKEEIIRRYLVEESVAEQFGIKAPFPGQVVREKYAAWVERNGQFEATTQRFAALMAKALEVPEQAAALASCFNRLRAALVYRDRVKVPHNYLSWAHIADFLEPPNTNGADHDAVRSARPSDSATPATRNPRIPSLAGAK